MNSKGLVNYFVWNHQYLRNLLFLILFIYLFIIIIIFFFFFFFFFWGGFYCRLMCIYIHVATSSDCSLLTFILPFKMILRRFEVFSDVWSENTANFKRLINENLFKSTNRLLALVFSELIWTLEVGLYQSKAFRSWLLDCLLPIMRMTHIFGTPYISVRRY